MAARKKTTKKKVTKTGAKKRVAKKTTKKAAATSPTAGPATVAEYLRGLAPDRKAALQAVRKVVKANLDPKLKEGIQYKMIGYFVPHSVYPAGYHCDPSQPLPYFHLASQKHHMALYAFCVYTDPGLLSWFVDAWTATGKKLDMGKSCVRFKKIEDVPLEVVGELVKRATAKKFIAMYEESRGVR